MNELSSWLALDVGTHAVRAGVVGHNGELVAVAHQPVSLQRLDDRRIEQDADEVLAALYQVIDTVLAESPLPVKAAGLACQRSTVVAWCRDTGQALGPALSWQDTRGWQQVEDLRTEEDDIRRRSGLVLSPHYGASKIRYLQNLHRAQPSLCVSPLVAYLLHHLLLERPCVCDEGNAGRMQLWSLAERRWDPWLVERFGVEASLLPNVQPTMSRFGTLRQKGLPLLAVAGDQNAALCGTLAPEQQDRVLANLGSGAFVLTFSGTGEPPAGLLCGLAYSTEEDCRGIWEGTVNGAGLALTWLAQQAAVQVMGGETWLLTQLPGWLLDPKLLSDKAIFYNTIGGLGSPFWRSGGVATFSAEVAGTAQQAVALVESIVFLVAINVARLRKAKPEIATVCLTGGLARLDGLCQRLADLLQLPVVRLAQPEATLVGCARMASAFTLPLQVGEEKGFVPGQQAGLEKRFLCFKDWLNRAA